MGCRHRLHWGSSLKLTVARRIQAGHPDRLFPVIWAVLYVLMSLAAARVATTPDSAFALGLWALQITISTLWSAVFLSYGGKWVMRV